MTSLLHFYVTAQCSVPDKRSVSIPSRVSVQPGGGPGTLALAPTPDYTR